LAFSGWVAKEAAIALDGNRRCPGSQGFALAPTGGIIPPDPCEGKRGGRAAFFWKS